MAGYTEYVLKLDIKEDTPNTVINILKYLFTDNKPLLSDIDLPNHKFFSDDRWKTVVHDSSFYHHPGRYEQLILDSEWNSADLFTRLDTKFTYLIEEFLDWLKPYIKTCDELTCIGYTWYEDTLSSSLIYLNNNEFYKFDTALVTNLEMALMPLVDKYE